MSGAPPPRQQMTSSCELITAELITAVAMQNALPGLQLHQQHRADARRFVTAFRLWMDANGGSVGWAPGVSTELPPRETSREALLDRYNSHTKHCPSCSGVRCTDWAQRLTCHKVAGAGTTDAVCS